MLHFMLSPFDTIVAPITGNQPAAVALVRLSGAESWEVAGKVFLAWPRNPESHRATYGRYSTGDDGLVIPFEEGHSYTGERSVELSCHGSPVSVRALVEACIQAGARHAEAGEFTQRAFLNGRMDLTEAEAVADTVNAQTEAQLRMANRQREGALHKEVSALRNRVLKVLVAVEASVDFEEEIGPLDRDSARGELADLSDSVEALLKTADLGHIMRSGLRIAIVGPPNAGKSSLFNAIVGRERAIVTPIAGTTRDYVEESVDMGGVPVVLIDTAGLRETEDEVESIGIEHAKRQMRDADLTWLVYDADDVASMWDWKASVNPTCLVANKVDLHGKANADRLRDSETRTPLFCVSARTGEGLAELVATVAELAERAGALHIPPISDRHKPLLMATRRALNAATASIKDSRPDDLLSTLLRGAANDLGEITGETATEDMIERIFADFCIGK